MVNYLVHNLKISPVLIIWITFFKYFFINFTINKKVIQIKKEILYHMMFDIIFGEQGKLIAEKWDQCTARRDASGQQKEDDRLLNES